MRHLATLILMLLLVTFFAVPQRSARSEGDVRRAEIPEVKVSLAVVERGRQSTGSPLHMIIENVSKQPQSHFDEWNSWGYGNVTLDWTDAQGHTGTVTKVPGAWTRNGPTTTILQPGEALVREVSFDPKLWQGWPAITNFTTLTLKAGYRSTGEPQVSNSAAGWTGTVNSKERTVIVWQPAAR
ncbi:MAG: hypothetical protein ACHRHE_12705 [Tepidisphaerales bacterium]